MNFKIAALVMSKKPKQAQLNSISDWDDQIKKYLNESSFFSIRGLEVTKTDVENNKVQIQSVSAWEIS